MTGADRVARQVGSALRRVRERRSCWQYQLAEAAGIPRRQLAAYERGREQPSVAALVALLTALDCTADEYGQASGTVGVPAVKATHAEGYRLLLRRLRQARQEARLTQDAVGQLLGVRQAFMSKVESGERRIDPVELARLAAIYRKPVVWFLA
jgi:transcriptional regulator with XRE-family HTH domain